MAGAQGEQDTKGGSTVMSQNNPNPNLSSAFFYK